MTSRPGSVQCCNSACLTGTRKGRSRCKSSCHATQSGVRPIQRHRKTCRCAHLRRKNATIPVSGRSYQLTKAQFTFERVSGTLSDVAICSPVLSATFEGRCAAKKIAHNYCNRRRNSPVCRLRARLAKAKLATDGRARRSGDVTSR